MGSESPVDSSFLRFAVAIFAMVFGSRLGVWVRDERMSRRGCRTLEGKREVAAKPMTRSPF